MIVDPEKDETARARQMRVDRHCEKIRTGLAHIKEPNSMGPLIVAFAALATFLFIRNRSKMKLPKP